MSESTDLIQLDDRVGTALSADEFKKRRDRLLQFINHQLAEAQYDDRGYPVAVNDYYVVPGSKKKALSKKGAELIGQLYKFAIREAEIVHSVCEKDYCMARARVILHRSGVIVGAQSGSCSTAEKGFQSERAKKKYGGDYRSAVNDIEARAQKRAYVRAMIAACGASDILEAADDAPPEEHIPDAEYEVVDDPLDPKPASNGGPTREQLLRLTSLITHPEVTEAERQKTAKWLNTEKATSEAVDNLIARLEERVNG
jgi:hypothetical protein